VAVLALSGPKDGPARVIEALASERDFLIRMYWTGLFCALSSRVFLTYLVFSSTIQVI
jgi:hypothetical protein